MSPFQRIRASLYGRRGRRAVPEFWRRDASPLSVLRLEERRVLNAAPLTEFQQPDAVDREPLPNAPADVVDAGAYAGDGQADVFHIRRAGEGPGIEVFVNESLVFQGPLESGALTLLGSGDDDTLVIDYSAGDPLAGLTLTFDVGGPGGNDVVLYRGGAGGDAFHQFAAGESLQPWSYHAVIGGGRVSVVGMAPGEDQIVDLLVAPNRSLEFSLPGETIELAAHSSWADGAWTASVDGLSFLHFAPPTASLTIAGDGAGAALVGPGEFHVEQLIIAAETIRVEQMIVAEAAQMRAVESLHVSQHGGVRLFGAADSPLVLDAGSGTLEVAGVINASSSLPGARGGTIHLLGGHIRLTETARIDASGDAGGGTILVGGDFQGRNPDIPNARTTIIESGTVLAADAIVRGDGGRIIVWADESTWFAGALSARGGPAGGDGGFAEVSGKDKLAYRGFADLSSPRGKRGELLLDPRDITIAAVGATPIEPNNAFTENPGDDVTISTAAITAATTSANLTLQANRDILVTVDVLGGGGNLTLEAGRTISLDAGVTIDTLAGNLTLLANSASAIPGQRGAGPGQVVMQNGASLVSTGTVIVEVAAGAESGDIVLGNVTAPGVSITNLGATAGSGVRRAFDNALISGAMGSVTFNVAAAGAEIGAEDAPLRVQVDNLSAQGQSGGVFIDSPTQGVAVIEITTAADGSIRVTAAGDIFVFEGITAGGAGDILLHAGTAEIITGSPVTSGSGDITFTSDDITLEAPVQSTGGTLLLQPFSVGRPIRIGGGFDGLRYHLDNGEIDFLHDGFSSITIGRSDGAHEVIVEAASFRDPLVIQAPATGGAIAVEGQLDTLAGAGANSITRDGPTTLADDMVTAGGGLRFSGAVAVAKGESVLVDATNAGAVLGGAAITFEGAVNGDATDPAAETLRLNAGTAGAVVFESPVGGAEPLDVTVIHSGSTTFEDAVAAGVVTLVDTTGAVAFQENATIATLTTSGGGYSLSFTGADNTIANSVTFDNRGTVTLGDDSGDQFTFAGGATVNAPTRGPTLTTLAGLIEATNDTPLTLLGPATLASNVTIRADRFNLGANLTGGGFALTLEPDEASDAVQIGAGAAPATDVLTINAATIANLVPNTFSGIVIGRTDGTGLVTVVGAAVFADPLTIRASSAGAIHVNAPLSTTAGLDAAALTLDSAGGPITLAGDLTTRSGTITLGGDVRVADGATVSIDSSDGGAVTGADLVFNHAVNGDTATAALETLRTNSGTTGDTRFEATAGAAAPLSITIDQSQSAVFADSLHAATVRINATETSVAFEGNATIDAGLATQPGGYDISFTGDVNTIAGATAFRNTGVVTLGNAASDSFLFAGGPATAGSPTNPSLTRIAASVATPGAEIILGPTELQADAALDTTAGGAFPAGAAIRFAGDLDGGFDLTLLAGSGDISFDSPVGQAAPLGDVVIDSAADVTASAAFSAASLMQTNGAPGATTAFLGPLNTSGSGGIDLTTFQISFAGRVQTAGGGGVRLNNGGLLQLGAGADMNLDGPFQQVGPGAVTSAADIVTTGDSISFASPVTLTGPVSIDTGAAAGDVAFAASIDGGGFDLSLRAGRQLTLQSPVNSVADFRLDSGELTTLAPGAEINALGAVTFGLTGPGSLSAAADIRGDSITLHRAATLIGDRTLAAQNALMLHDDVSSSGRISLLANQDNAGAEGFLQTAGTVQTASAAADAITLHVGGQGDVQLAALAANAAAGGVSLIVGGAVRDNNGAAVNVTAHALTIDAGQGVDLDTSVNQAIIDAVAGDILLDELDGITLQRIAAAAGMVLIRAGGDTRIEDISALAVDIALSAGDATVVAVTSPGAVELTADSGAILDDGDNATQITADVLTLRAAGSAGRADPQAELDIAASELVAIVGGEGLFVTAANTLALQQIEAMAPGTDVRIVAAAGDLVVVSVRADDEIDLNAPGGGIVNPPGTTATLSARTLNLQALQGVGAAAEALRFTAAEIAAIAGELHLASLAAGPVTATSLVAGQGPLSLVQTGGQPLTVVSADAAMGGVAVANDGADLQADLVSAGLASDVRLTTTGAGDILLGSVKAGGNAVVTSEGAIAESVPDPDIDIVAAGAALRAAIGIGSGDPLEIDVATLAAENAGPGNVQINYRGASLLTIGVVDVTAGVTLADSGLGGGAFTLDSTGPVAVNAEVLNAAGGDILLNTLAAGPAGDLTINARVRATGGDGDILINAGGSLILSDTGFDADISVSGDGQFVADFQGGLISADKVLVTSGIGAAVPGRPRLTSIEASQVTALGEAVVTGNFGSPGERGFLLTVDWGDNTRDVQQLDEPGDLRLEHMYVGNPNRENPAAPIPIELTLARNSNISFVGLDKTTFIVGVADVTADGDSLFIQIEAPVPGEGLFITSDDPAFGGAIEQPDAPPRVESADSSSQAAPPPAAGFDVMASSGEAGID
ncbi:MAG: hypothetical protein KY475_00485, partial [Planctomycetes bacterium]|nr:hypothetical protein [Planctomycetota bacterium]